MVGGLGGFDVQLAVKGVPLVHRAGVVAGLPAQHRHQIRQQSARLRQCQPDGVPAVHQPAPADPRIVVCRSDIQGEPGKLRRAADHVPGAVQHRTRHAGIKMRPGHPIPEDVTVPVRSRIGGRRHLVGADAGQVVAGPRIIGAPVRTGGQHGAAVEVEHQPIGLVDGDHPQRRQPRGRPARLDRVGPQPNHFGARIYGVTDYREPVKGETAVEQVCFDPLGHQRRLPDRDVAHQRRMRQRPRHAGHRGGENGVARQAHPVPQDRLMSGGHPRRQRRRRRPIEHLTHREVVEIGAALALARIPVRSHNATCWQAVQPGVNAEGGYR